MKKEITTDSFLRTCSVAITVAAVLYLLNLLSAALLPFFIALGVAYMIHPLVDFFEKKCHLHSRVISIFLSVILVLAIIAAAFFLIVPPLVHQLVKLKELTQHIIYSKADVGVVPTDVITYMNNYLSTIEFFKNLDYVSILNELAPKLMAFIGRTFSMVYGIFTIFMVFLYLFFILMDYETITKGWLKFIPLRHQERVTQLVEDVKMYMSKYFRGQSLIALMVGVMFAIGFSFINFPMAIGLGLFIGLLNMVPYLQLVSLIPAALLAALKASETNSSFWFVMLQVLIIYAVVQIIQDFVLTPWIMGKNMGLNPAIILLSLSVWGALLGFIGLIIALPLTTILKAYYKQYRTMKDQEYVENEEFVT
ncbi:MAG: AI-2E family transporter [Bacteroidales bacterium]|nr:AI-2E family transporter [Candidatus Minthousia equi]